MKNWMDSDVGPERREAILRHIKEFGKLLINSSGCPNSKKDKDIRYLLKRNKVKQIRVHCGYSNSHHSDTYLILKEKL